MLQPFFGNKDTRWAETWQELGEGAPTLAQINAYNQASAACRIVQMRQGGAHVLYSALLFSSTTREDAATHLAAWQGCLADARDFARDPVRFLAEAA